MSGGTRINTVIAHGRENVEEKKNKVPGGKNQEIRGGVLEDLAEKARHTTNTGKTSRVKFRGIYDDNQGHDVFGVEGIGCPGADGGK